MVVVLCTLLSVLCQLYSVLCYLYSVLCQLYSVLCYLYSTSCTLFSVLCSLYSVLYSYIAAYLRTSLLQSGVVSQSRMASSGVVATHQMWECSGRMKRSSVARSNC